MNLVLKDEHRMMIVSDKIRLLSKNKNLDNISIHKNYLREPCNFRENLISIYKNHGIQFELIEVKNLIQVLDTIMHFMLRVGWKMQKVLPINDELLDCIANLNPLEFSLRKWKYLGEKFVNVISDDEFTFFYKQAERFELNISNIKKLLHESKQEFPSLYDLTIIQQEYPLMCKLAKAVLGIPYSTAHLERAFSQLQLIKTPLRNSQRNETTEALMVCKTSLDLLNLEDRKVMDCLMHLFQIYMKNKIDDKKEKFKRKADAISMVKEFQCETEAKILSEEKKVPEEKKFKRCLKMNSI